MLPLDEEPFEVNANTRKINIPTSLKQIGVVGDNYAEIVFFKIDRYFDAVDFGSESINATIEWQKLSGNKNSGISPAWVKNLSREYNYVLIGWVIQEEMTEEAGNIEFSLRLTQKNPNSENKNELIYSFSTEPAIVSIGKSLNLYQSGDEIEYSGNNDLIKLRITSAIAADDSYGLISDPRWNIDIDSYAIGQEYINDTYYLDLDETGNLSITLQAELTSGNAQENARYTWQKQVGPNWETITPLEGADGATCIFNSVGHYRCRVEDTINESSRSYAYSKEFYILGPETPKVKVADNNNDYIPVILSEDENEMSKLIILPEINNTDYFEDLYGAKENTTLSYNWYKTIGLGLDKGESISSNEEYNTNTEGYYFGNVIATRNKESIESENYTTYRVTKKAANPLKEEYYITGLSDNDGYRGVLIKNDQGIVTSAETIKFNFEENFQFDNIEYQWYHKRNDEDIVWNKLSTPQSHGITSNYIEAFKYTPDEWGMYQVRIIVNRNGSTTVLDTNEETKWDNAYILPRKNSTESSYIHISNKMN